MVDIPLFQTARRCSKGLVIIFKYNTQSESPLCSSHLFGLDPHYIVEEVMADTILGTTISSHYNIPSTNAILVFDPFTGALLQYFSFENDWKDIHHYLMSHIHLFPGDTVSSSPSRKRRSSQPTVPTKKSPQEAPAPCFEIIVRQLDSTGSPCRLLFPFNTKISDVMNVLALKEGQSLAFLNNPTPLDPSVSLLSLGMGFRFVLVVVD
ncbi:hypothetical protein P9112_013809 [Eukaryota sp. TZLM1-RC]